MLFPYAFRAQRILRPTRLFALALLLLPSSYADFPNPPATGLPAKTVIELTPPRPVPDWVRSNLRRAHLPGVNGAWRMLDRFVAAGYNTIAVNTLAMWDRVGPAASLYPQATVSAADTYLRRVVDTIHAGGARAVFYIGPVQIPTFSPEFRAAHPDWLLVRSNGSQDQGYNNILNPGFADFLEDQLVYLATTYGVDGFWFDGFAPVSLHSYDSATNQLFLNYSGQNIPNTFDPINNPVARTYLDWHNKKFIDYADRLRGSIRAARADCVIFGNYSAARTWYYPGYTNVEYPAAYGMAIDIPSVEQYWDYPNDALYQQFEFAYAQAVSHDRGAAVWIQPQAFGITGISPPVEIQLRGLEAAPWGVYPEFVESTGREEYMQLSVDNIKAREAWWIHSEPVPFVGIVVSEQTREYYKTNARAEYLSHVLGAFKALQESHIPVRLLTEYDLENVDLQGVRVLVLPNVACMSDRAVEVVRRFANSGGGVVATFESSLRNQVGVKRSNFGLGDVLRATYVSTQAVLSRDQVLYNEISLSHPILEDTLIRSRQRNAWTNPNGNPNNSGPLEMVAPAVRTALLGAPVQALRWYQPSVGTRYPAMLTSTFGQGRCVYFPAAFDRGMYNYPDGYMRNLLKNAVEWAGQTPAPIEVEGPLALTTTFRRQPASGNVVVHLLNAASSRGLHSMGYENSDQWTNREEILPLIDIKVFCRLPNVQSARLQPEDINLPLEFVDGQIQVTVPRINMYSMVVFSPIPQETGVGESGYR